MSDNPFEAIRKACDSFGRCFQTHLSRILPAPLENHLSKPSYLSWSSKASFFSFFNASKPSDVNDAGLLAPNVSVLEKKITAAPLTKEELGRATWTLLHAVAAQFPDSPTRQQKKDVKELMAILSRIYPCKECAEHFKEVLKLQFRPRRRRLAAVVDSPRAQIQSCAGRITSRVLPMAVSCA